jgi:hypothetical protein
MPGKFSPLIILLLVFMCTAAGCSYAGTNSPAAAPALDANDSAGQATDSRRILRGIWSIHFNPADMSITAEPVRNPQAHYDITPMVIPPACDDCLELMPNAFDPVTRILDVEVTLRNQFPLAGRDVRGILHANDEGHLLTNADSWTAFWDKPGGEDINPFKAFAKAEANRIFGIGAEHTEKYLVYIPKPPKYYAITFAVDASRPGNCKEPYSIENFMLNGELYDYSGAQADVTVDVLDWQDDVSHVTLTAQEITGESQTPRPACI